MEDVFGTDVSTFTADGDGLDPMMELISGPRVVLENCARRLSAEGLLGAPDYGFDLIQCVGQRASYAAQIRVADRIVAELKKEEGVLDAGCTIEVVNRLEWKVRIALHLVTGAPAFKLVLKVTDVTLEILKNDRG